jgi:hypothetical protein
MHMPTMNGVTPEEKAKEIVNQAFEDKMAMISGTTFQKLTTVVRYLNRDKIQARGESWFTKNFDSLTTDALDDLIKAREKAITSYLAKRNWMRRTNPFVSWLQKVCLYLTHTLKFIQSRLFICNLPWPCKKANHVDIKTLQHASDPLLRPRF